MPFTEPPPLPPFLDRTLRFDRGAFILPESAGTGADAGRRLAFIDHGPRDARPVLLMHGNPTWGYLWRKVIAGLPELRCVAPDLLGLGFSDRLPAIADHTVERHADAIAALVEALDLEGAILVGQDWGGPIVAGVGARLPGRIAGLVLANTSVLLPKRPRGTLFHRFARLPIASDLAFRGLGFPQTVLGRVQGDPRSISGATARAYRWPLRGWRNRVAPLALARMVPNGPQHPSIPELERGEAWATGFDGPMALVWGERDPVLGRLLGRHSRTFPDASVFKTDAGHFLQEEVPEVLVQAIRETAGRAG